MALKQKIQMLENLSEENLLEESILRGEGVLAANGALLVKTGKRTGRSPKDRFIVEDSITHSEVDWGEINIPFEQNKFTSLW